MSLKGSKTEKNLKAAFAGESQANRRYLYFAQKADVERIRARRNASGGGSVVWGANIQSPRRPGGANDTPPGLWC